MTSKDIDISRQITLVRIHVILQLNTAIPIAQVDLTDNIMVTI